MNEREKQALVPERERQTKAQRTYENDLHAMEIRENNLTNQIGAKGALEASMKQMKLDIDSFHIRSKVIVVLNTRRCHD